MRFNKSLKFKLIFASCMFILMIVAGCLLLTNLFLSRYYYYSKTQALTEAFDTINSAYTAEMQDLSDDDDDDDDFDLDDLKMNQDISDSLELKLDQISLNNNFSIIIYRDFDDNIVDYYNINPDTKLMLYSSLGMNPDGRVESSNIYSDYVNSGREYTAMESSDRYTIKRLNVKRLGASYIYLDGRMGNNDSILIRVSVAGIQESVRWSTRFFLYVSLLIALISIVIMSLYSDHFIKPIRELTHMARRMSDLDFTAKYEVTTEDELGDLGRSINSLSEKLETSLAELKAANTELRKDLEHREEMDEMRKEFLSNVSHELKTPIALIQGYAEGLLDNINDDEESRQFYCEVIVDEARKMNGMVKQIMALNQLEFGYSHVNMEYFDVVDLIRGVLAKSVILQKQKDAHIIFDQEEPLYVWSDAFMTEEVFTNYFTNALNHLDGERRIEISLLRDADSVCISVFNTGEPIPEADLVHVWDKFYKVDKARTREYGGSGVGLSIVKATMELLGQDYGVENLNDGVRFWFYLDCSQTHREEKQG